MRAPLECLRAIPRACMQSAVHVCRAACLHALPGARVHLALHACNRCLHTCSAVCLHAVRRVCMQIPLPPCTFRCPPTVVRALHKSAFAAKLPQYIDVAAYYGRRMQSERVVIAGAGALGCYFGGMLARAGEPVTLDWPQPRSMRSGTTDCFSSAATFRNISGSTRKPSTAPLPEERSFCCASKREGALLVSFQNGVDNVEQSKRATGIEASIPYGTSDRAPLMAVRIPPDL